MADIKIKTPVKDTGGLQDVDPVVEPVVEPGNEPTPPVKKEEDVDKSTPSTDPTPTDSPIITVDDVEYKLDKDGNAVKEDGSVFMSKEELDKLSKADEPTPDDNNEPIEATIADLEKLSGIEIRDTSGSKVEFDLTLESLAKREKAIKDLGVKEGTSKALDNFFKENPDIYRALAHKQKTGSLDGFTTQPIYKSMQVDTNNEEQLINLIVEAEVKKGSSPERARSIAKYFKAENQLAKEGQDAHKFLVSLEDKEIQSYEQIKQQNYKQAIEQEAKLYGTYYDESGKEVVVDTEGSFYNKIVTKGQFGNFVIPEGGIKLKAKDGSIKTLSRRDIFDYVAKPVTENGLSQAQVDEMNRLKNTDNLLSQWIGNLTGNDFSQLIERKILEEKSKVIKARLSTKSTTKTPSTPSTGNLKLKVPVK